MSTKHTVRFGCCGVIAWLSLVGCGDSAADTTKNGDAGAGAAGKDAGAGFCHADETFDLSACDPKQTKLSLTIDNPYYPLVVGQTSVFEGEEDGEQVHLEIEVLDEVEKVAGIDTRVIEEREQHDGEIVEISRNFFAQAEDGTVCYFGEDVDIYEAGKITAHDGAWRAEGKNRAGMVMPPAPKVGDFFAQEDAPSVAEDRAEITTKGETVKVPAGEYTDTFGTSECTPMEPGVSESKYYARGIGLITDGPVELVSH